MDEAFRTEAKFTDLFTAQANRKALLFTCLLVMFQQFSGINVVLFYMDDIFVSANSSLNSAVATIIVGAVQTGSSAITPVIVDKLPRRALLIFSGIGETLALVSAALSSPFHSVSVSPRSSSANSRSLPLSRRLRRFVLRGSLKTPTRVTLVNSLIEFDRCLRLVSLRIERSEGNIPLKPLLRSFHRLPGWKGRVGFDC